MKAALFDLDNTLYPEIEFVKSGFRAVAHYLASRYHLDEDALVEKMQESLQRDGRGKIFDGLLHDLGVYSEDRLRLLVYLYRSHRPTIHLFDDVSLTLEYLKARNLYLGLVTNGMASVQKRKIAGLGLDSIFDVIVCTDELGKEYWKPSVVPFQVALEWLGISPSEATYIGDDPRVDFVGPNSLGMLTIQIKRRELQSSRPEASPEHFFCAKFVVEGLQEILPIVVA
jgi:putative hydrolase of the HAD superfamily